jgi:hypothetical protein
MHIGKYMQHCLICLHLLTNPFADKASNILQIVTYGDFLSHVILLEAGVSDKVMCMQCLLSQPLLSKKISIDTVCQVASKRSDSRLFPLQALISVIVIAKNVWNPTSTPLHLCTSEFECSKFTIYAQHQEGVMYTMVWPNLMKACRQSSSLAIYWLPLTVSELAWARVEWLSSILLCWQIRAEQSFVTSFTTCSLLILIVSTIYSHYERRLQSFLQ